MMFATKVGSLRWNVREVFARGAKQYQSSLGYAATLREAKEMTSRDPSRHTQVVNSAGEVRFEKRASAPITHYRNRETGELAPPHVVGIGENGVRLFQFVEGWEPVNSGVVIVLVDCDCDCDGNWIPTTR